MPLSIDSLELADVLLLPSARDDRSFLIDPIDDANNNSKLFNVNVTMKTKMIQMTAALARVRME